MAVALVLVGTLALTVAQQPPSLLDLSVTRALQRISLPGFTTLMAWISVPGNNPLATVLAVVISLLLGVLIGWRSGLFTLLAAFVENELNTLLKVWVARPRPTADLVEVRTVAEGLSFPSGHVMFYTVFFGLIAWILWRHQRAGWRWPLIALCLALIALVGPSRITLGAHWFSDVVAAYLLSGALLYAAILLYERFLPTQSR